MLKLQRSATDGSASDIQLSVAHEPQLDPNFGKTGKRERLRSTTPPSEILLVAASVSLAHRMGFYLPWVYVLSEFSLPCDKSLEHVLSVSVQ